MKRIIACITLASLTLILCCQAQPTSVYAQDTTPAAIERLLGQSGYSYIKKTNNVWAIDFRGKTLPQFKVVVTTGKDLVVIFVTVIEKRNFTATPEALRKLLKLNHDLDRVKVGLDRDEDISVRIDLSPRVVDLQELKVNIEQVTSSADAVYSAMRPFVTAAK